MQTILTILNVLADLGGRTALQFFQNCFCDYSQIENLCQDDNGHTRILIETPPYPSSPPLFQTFPIMFLGAADYTLELGGNTLYSRIGRQHIIV